MNFNIGNPVFGAPVIVNPPIITRTFSNINRTFVVEQPYIHEHVTNIVNHHIKRNVCCYKPICCEQNTFCEQNVNCCPAPTPCAVPPAFPGVVPGVVPGPVPRPLVGGAQAPQQFQ